MEEILALTVIDDDKIASSNIIITEHLIKTDNNQINLTKYLKTISIAFIIFDFFR